MNEWQVRQAPGPRLWVPNFRVVETVISLPGAVKQLVAANPDRVAIIFSAQLGGSSAFISTSNAPALTQGFILGQNAPVQSFTWSQHGGFVQQAFFCSAGGAGASLTIIEVLWASQVGD